MSAQVLLPLVSALVSAIIVGGFTTWNTRYTQKQLAEQQEKQRQEQRESDHYADTRALRDAKRERLRTVYASLLQTANTLSILSGSGDKFNPHWTGEERERRLANAGKDSVPQLQIARDNLTLLSLESDAEEVEAIFTTILGSFQKARVMRTLRERGQGNFTEEAIEAEVRLLNNGIERLETQARNHLASLELSVPTLAPPTLRLNGGGRRWWPWNHERT